MEIFSANPKSFKIRRSSLLASSKLKPAISAKLSHFLPELTDDVFAEYITVLVCNGKNQYQAREDLEAFLGERSREFVSWLWIHVFECVHPERSLENYYDSLSSPRNSDRDVDTRTRSTYQTEDFSACKKEISDRVSLANRDHGVLCANKPEKILDRKVLPELKQISHFSTRDHAVKKSSSFVSDHPSYNTSCSAPTAKRRVSVWDRLGKPSNNIDNHNQEEKVNNMRASIASSLEGGASLLNKGSEDLKEYGENGNLQNYISGTFDRDSSTDIQRKRLFSSGDPRSVKENRMLVSSVSEIPQVLKKSKLSTNDLGTPPSFASKVLVMKERLRKVEMEMSELRLKQVNIKKDGKPCQMSNPSEFKKSEEDIESRTILVSNVHFAATEETLSLFFAKCGVIVDVVKTADLVTAKPNGFAYVTFASKDSIDRALELSGTTFFSRIVKVSRKEEQKPSQASSLSRHVNSVHDKPYNSVSRRQWRRDNVNCA